MKIAMIGLGKLGLPVALAMAGVHDVTGYDVLPETTGRAAREGLKVSDLGGACLGADIVFVAVQTPHEKQFEGVTKLPSERRDFDYRFLKAACASVRSHTENGQIVVVISTVLPGTMESEIYPLLGGRRVGYNPAFIAMGTVAQDYLNPEFVLLGSDDDAAAATIERFYRELLGKPETIVYRTSVRNAELIKVAYNTFIGMKLAFANTLLEICEKTECDVDAVTTALGLARDRLISTSYLTAGMGDGGGCHPRDNIALSWLARKIGLKHDWFDSVMRQREGQAEWLADLLMAEHDATGLPIAIYGTAFKPGVDIEIGSHAMLVTNILIERGQDVELFDPLVATRSSTPPDGKQFVFLLGCSHKAVLAHRFARGSVVLDPWRLVEDQPGVKVLRLGQPRPVSAAELRAVK